MINAQKIVTNINKDFTSQSKQIWIDYTSDLVAGVKAYSACISLSDIMNDDESRFVCADINGKLKVFNGKLLQSEANLNFTPVGILPFYSPDKEKEQINTKKDKKKKDIDPDEGNSCFLAVGGGSFIFIYKKLKGHYKFSIPNFDPDDSEIQVWNLFKEEEIEYKKGIDMLIDFHENGIALSTRSLELLSLTEELERHKFITERKHIPIINSNYLTCMTTCFKKQNSNKSTSHLVFGTEQGYVYIIDEKCADISNIYRIQSVPVIVEAFGDYDSNLLLYVVTRSGLIYSISKNGTIVNNPIRCRSKICGIKRIDMVVVVATMDSYLTGYHTTNGQLKYSVQMPSNITNIEKFEQKDPKTSEKFTGIIITLQNGEIRFYNEKILITTLKFPEPILGIKYGIYGKQENSLVILTESGSMFIKNLKPDVLLNKIVDHQEKTDPSSLPLNVPKKTKLFLDLMTREKDQASNMHQTFQMDLMKLKHKTLETYVKMLKIGNAPQNYSTVSKLQLNASLQGLGPNFRLVLNLINSGDEPITSTDLMIDYDRQIFQFDKDYILLSILMPNIPMKSMLRFRNISETGNSGLLKIIVLDKEKTTPLITSTLKVPISEMELM